VRHILPRRGVTLLELIVVLALLGLVLAIAAPSFIVPNAGQQSELGRAIEAARRAALLRGEAVTLSLARDGSWHVVSDVSPNAPSIAVGTFRGPTTPLRIHVSALGTCVPESADGSTVPTWNATSCSAMSVPNQSSTP
jgi:type IV fimbrial biogenesis protein FimU